MVQGSKEAKNNVRFNSENINHDKKPDYFAGRVKEKPFKVFLNFIFGGFHKFITIGVAAALLIASILLVLFLTVWSQSPKTEDKTIDNSATWPQDLSEINKQAYSILDSDSESAYLDATNYLDSKLKEVSKPDQKFDVVIVYANFLIYNNDANGALVKLSSVDEDSLSDSQKFSFYLASRFAYQKLDNQESVDAYTAKIDSLPKDITTVGGPADE